jgi:putative flippase GtrA
VVENSQLESHRVRPHTGLLIVRAQQETPRRIVRFAALGAAGFVLNLVVTVSLHEWLGAPEELAFAVALAVVFVFSFLTSRHLIFAGAVDGDPKKQLLKFAVFSAGFRVSEYLGFLVLHTLLRLPYLPSIVAVLGVSFLTKFFTYSTVVFVDDREVP